MLDSSQFVVMIWYGAGTEVLFKEKNRCLVWWLVIREGDFSRFRKMCYGVSEKTGLLGKGNRR